MNPVTCWLVNGHFIPADVIFPTGWRRGRGIGAVCIANLLHMGLAMASPYIPLHTPTCSYMLLYARTYPYIPLHTPTYPYMLLPAPICPYMPLHAPTYPYIPVLTIFYSVGIGDGFYSTMTGTGCGGVIGRCTVKVVPNPSRLCTSI